MIIVLAPAAVEPSGGLDPSIITRFQARANSSRCISLKLYPNATHSTSSSRRSKTLILFVCVCVSSRLQYLFKTELPSGYATVQNTTANLLFFSSCCHEARLTGYNTILTTYYLPSLCICNRQFWLVLWRKDSFEYQASSPGVTI